MNVFADEPFLLVRVNVRKYFIWNKGIRWWWYAGGRYQFSIVTSVTFSRRAMRHGASWGFLINIIVSSFEKISYFHKKIWTDFFGQRFFRSTECRPLLFGRVYVYGLSTHSQFYAEAEILKVWQLIWLKSKEQKSFSEKWFLSAEVFLLFEKSEVRSQSVGTFFSFIKQETIRKINEREQMKL